MNQPVNWETPVSQPVPVRADWLTVIQLFFSGFFTLVYGAAAVGLLAFSLPKISTVTSLDPSPLLSYSMGLACVILALFNLASAYYSGKKLKLGFESIRTEKNLKWLNGIILLLPILIIVGVLVYPSEPTRNYMLPILTTLIVVLGVIWLVRLGSGKAWGAHPQRDSGMFSVMSGFTIWFIMILEVMVLAIIGIIMLVGLISNLAQTQQLNTLTSLLQTQPDFVQIMQTIENVLPIPTLIGLGFLVIAVIMPTIEELFKTIGVWLLAGRNLTPAEGWVAGLMSGAGFALVEGLFYSMQMAVLPDQASWVFAVIGRSGGSLLHTFCGGLIGWAFAKTWKDHKVWRVIGMFVLVIFIHGLWNGLALIPTISLFGVVSESTANLTFLPLMVVMIVIFIAFLNSSRKVTGQA